MSLYKPIPFKPFTGPLDLRSEPDAMAPGSWRKRLNTMTTAPGTLDRRDGWIRFRGDGTGDANWPGYNNQDLHDQLLTLCDGSPSSEHVTFGMQIETSWSTRYTLAGTSSRIYQLNEGTGNWRILADGWGNASSRWQAALGQDTVIFTNNVDKPLYYDIDSEPSGATNQSVHVVPDLETLLVERVRCVCAYKGCVFLANIQSNGQRERNRIIWSDYNKPKWFNPLRTAEGDEQASSIISEAEIYLQDPVEIIAMVEFADALMVFADRGIYKITPTGSTPAFKADRVWYQAQGDKCLAYPNTLVSTGDELFWLGRDNFYVMNAYMVAPETPAWLNLASAGVFSGDNRINPSACSEHVAGYTSDVKCDDGSSRKEIQLFWAPTGKTVPDRGMAIDVQYNAVHELDHGATACWTYRSDMRLSFREFMSGIACASLSARVKEGEPATPPTGTAPEAFLTSTTATIAGFTTEDWTQATPEAGSLAALIGDDTPEEMCGGECNNSQLFVFACPDDKCLKQAGGAYSRQIYTGSSIEDSWATQGYFSHLISGPNNFGVIDRDVNIGGLDLDAKALGYQSIPSAVGLRVGFSYSPLDPLDGDCSVLWTKQVNRLLKCRNLRSDAEYASSKTRPNTNEIGWGLFASGRWLYLEFVVGNLETQSDLRSDLLPGLGGACHISGALLKIRER